MYKSVIHIYGASGSGTTTLGRFIEEQLGYTFMDTDDYFWLPTNPKYTKKREKIDRLQMMKKEILNSDKVVISGSLVDWWDDLIPVNGEDNLKYNLELIKNSIITTLNKTGGQ